MLSPVFQWRGLYSLHSHLLASSAVPAPPPPPLLMPDDLLPTTTTMTSNNRKRKLEQQPEEDSSSSNNSLPFSRLMRLMAAKYQEKEEAAEKAAAEALAANAQAAAALFSPFLPYLPAAATPPAVKRPRTEDAVPLDLSRGSTPELDVGGGGDDTHADNEQDNKLGIIGTVDKNSSSISNGSPKQVAADPAGCHASWSAERVAQFIEQIEESREYGQLFRDEKIDGSCLGSLSLYHLTAVLRIKIGPALKILKAVQALR